MSSEFTPSENPDDLNRVEQTLAALTPRPAQVDRDRLMFLAGAAAAGVQESGVGSREDAVVVRSHSWLWPAATLSLGATSLALALALFLRSNAPPQVVYVERPAPAAPVTSPRIATVQGPSPPSNPATEVAVAPPSAPRPAVRVPADNYVRSRDVALRMGLDALGGPRASSGGSAAGMTYLDWLTGLDREASRTDQPAGAGRVDSALPQM